MDKPIGKKIRIRFAPSPTGFLHVGSLRTVLYDYLFAKSSGGDFLLRIEDTDRKRYVEGSVEKLIESLEWAGISWDEGVYKNAKCKSQNAKCIDSKSYPGIVEIGEYGPYVQSERLEIYKKYAEQLVAEGKAYYCFCEPERLEKMREDQQKEKKAPMYDRYCMTNLNPDEINQKLKDNCPAVIRFKVPRGEEIVFEDMIYGKISVSSNTVDDQVLIKSDGFPTYHLAAVVDDHLMEITHVTRGEEWLPSTPKHILLYKAFGWEAPKFGHMPVLVNAEKKKLSKRHGDVAVQDYIDKGYLKDALINFIALLGWNPGQGSTQEIFSMKELEKIFDFKKIHKAGAFFDLKKLDWINNQYIKKLSIDELYSQVLPFLEKKEWFAILDEKYKSEEYLKKVLTVEQERLTTLAQSGEDNRFFFGDIAYDASMLKWKDMDNDAVKKSLEISKRVLKEINGDIWKLEEIEKALLDVAEENFKVAEGKVDRGALLWPLRVALTGAQKSPSPFEIAWVLGKDETLKRIGDAIEKIK
jgi:glutamyl-tRNA synthetase